MEWLALACTAENEVLAWSTDLAILESACLGDFRAISRIYGVDDLHATQLRQYNLDFKLKFDGPRKTDFIAHKKETPLSILSQQLMHRVGLMKELQERLAHGFKRFVPVNPWQLQAYELKYEQAKKVIAGKTSNIGLVEDYAAEAGLTLNVAASLIINKYENKNQLIRKLERLRMRYQIAIRNATNKEEFTAVRAAMEEDSFLSMLM